MRKGLVPILASIHCKDTNEHAKIGDTDRN